MINKKLFLVLAVGLLIAHYADAGVQLEGFAWSDGAGWISFENDNANAHWGLVNNESNATYIYTNSASLQYDAYKLDDPPFGSSGNISSVQVRAYYRGEIRMGLRLYGTENISYSGTYTGGFWRNTNWQTISRPGGGSWTWDDIEKLQIVIGSRLYNSTQGQVSRVYVRINGSLVLRPNGTGDYTGIDDPVPSVRYGYGVEANNSTGVLSGYAWSSNIGWISFEPASVVGCPIGPCQATINVNTGVVSGWARACSVFQSGCSGSLKSSSVLGGWEGWIRLKDGSYGVLLNYSVNPTEFYQWAWGGGINVGWISLNHTNTGSAVNYKVSANMSRPPTAIFICSKNPCRTYQGDADLFFTNISTDPDGIGDIVSSDWTIDSDPPTSCAGVCDFTPQTSLLTPSQSYSLKLRVTDTTYLWSEAITNFYILRDIYANIGCSLDGINLVACSGLSPMEGDTVYVHDLSVLSEGASSIIFRVWTDEFGVPFGTGQAVEAILAKAPFTTVNLAVADNSNRSDTDQLVIAGVLPLPLWKEIAPF